MTTKNKTLKQRTIRLIKMVKGDHTSITRLYVSVTGVYTMGSLEFKTLKEAHDKFNTFMKDSMSRGYKVK